MSVYLDLDTGEVIHVTADVREELEAIYAELPEEQTDAEANKAAYARASCACRNAIRTKAPWICRRSSRPSHTHAWRSGSGLQFGVAAPSAASKTCSLSIRLSACGGSRSKLLGCASGCWPGWRTTGSS